MNYWPERKNPDGFSIEKLAKSYRQKLSKVSQNISKENEGSSIDRDLIEKDDCGHWANRFFDEYRDAA